MTFLDHDTLIDRVVAGEAEADDFRRLSTLAAESPGTWTALARALRRERDLHDGVAATTRLAGTVEWPGAAPVADARRSAPRASGTAPGSGAWRAGSGWVAAALLGALLLASTLVPRPEGDHDGARTASVPLDASTALAHYVQHGIAEGRIVRELPLLTLSTSPTAPSSGDAGATDILYLRRFVERARVSDIYRIDRDEHGRPIAVRAAPPPTTSRESL